MRVGVQAATLLHGTRISTRAELSILSHTQLSARCTVAALTGGAIERSVTRPVTDDLLRSLSQHSLLRVRTVWRRVAARVRARRRHVGCATVDAR